MFRSPKRNGEQLRLLLSFCFRCCGEINDCCGKKWIDEDAKEAEVTLSYNQYEFYRKMCETDNFSPRTIPLNT